MIRVVAVGGIVEYSKGELVDLDEGCLQVWTAAVPAKDGEPRKQPELISIYPPGQWFKAEVGEWPGHLFTP